MMRKLLLVLSWALAISMPDGVRLAWARDEILLKSGLRIDGKILSQSRDHLVMEVGDGKVVYAKRAIRRIYDDITNEKPLSRMLKPGELPPWWVPLTDLYNEDWVTVVELIPPKAVETGNFKNVPYMPFRANKAYEMNIYGDPKDPAAIEIGYRGGLLRSGEASKRCRQFLVSYLGELDQIKALYGLANSGGAATVGGLTIEITPRSAPDALGGWWALIYNRAKVQAQRRLDDRELKAACARAIEAMKSSTDGETAWQKWRIEEVLARVLPSERMKER